MNKAPRLWVLDSFRGMAVLMMIGFHLTFDLATFGEMGIRRTFTLPLWYWKSVPNLIGGLFFSIVGISAVLRFQSQSKPSYRPFLKRGLQIFAIGMGITALTSFMRSNGVIYFGTLHGIGASLLLVYPFLRYSYANLLLSIFIIAGGIILEGYRFDTPLFLWLGFIPTTGGGPDCFPLIPWFGVVLLGVFLGQQFTKMSVAKVPTQSIMPVLVPPVRGLSWIGKHALWIYLLHQPLMLGLLYIAGLVWFQI